MSELTKYYDKYKIFVWSVAVVFICLAVTITVIIPQINSYMGMRDEIANLNTQSTKYEGRANELEVIDEVATRDGLNVVLTVLPTDEDIPEAMASLQDVVDQSGLILKTVSYNSSRSNDNSFQFSTTIVGPISSIKEFFIKMNEAWRVFRVDSISARFQRSSIITEADIPLSIFYTPSTQINLGSLDQPAPKLTDKEEKLLSQLSKSLPKDQGMALEATSSVSFGKSNPFE